MKTLRGFVIGLVVLGALGAAVWFVPALHVRAIVWALNSGIIPVEKADWGYLKLRSGKTGLDALNGLKNHSPLYPARAAASAVERQYHAAGALVMPAYMSDEVYPKESRFSELIMPDPRRFKILLAPGQTAPPTLLENVSFDVPCPATNSRQQPLTCSIHLADVDGDGQDEAVVKLPGQLFIYEQIDDRWEDNAVARISCLEDYPAFKQGNYQFQPQRFDDVMIDGHRLTFGTSNCSLLPWESLGKDTGPFRPQLADDLTSVRVISPANGKLPPSLIRDAALGKWLADRTSAENLTWPKSNDAQDINEGTIRRPNYVDWPGCASEHYQVNCLAVMLDLNHDGQDEVLLMRTAATGGMSYEYYPIVLLTMTEKHWHLSAVGERCQKWGSNLAGAAFSVIKARWYALHINGHDIAVAAESCPAEYFAIP